MNRFETSLIPKLEGMRLKIFQFVIDEIQLGLRHRNPSRVSNCSDSVGPQVPAA
jgi:hypothetical protein